MDCKTATAIVEDFREGHLDQAAKAELIDHMAQCKSCRQVLAHLDSIDQRLASVLGGVSVSPEFPARLEAALGKTEIAPAVPAVVRWLRPVALAAAACLVIGLSALFVMPALRHHEAPVKVMAPEGMLEFAEYEAPVNQPYAMGKPFVIGDNHVKPYSGKTSIIINRVQGHTPEVIVDAFPE